MSEIYDRLRAVREGGSVIRGHGIKQGVYTYTVGQHSYDVLSIILLLHPNPSAQLIKAALWHDVPERWTGDSPAPIKWRNPILREQLAKEEKVITDHFDLPSEHDLPLAEKAWLKGADMLELKMWCTDQRALGSQEVEGTLGMLEEAFYEISETLPEAIRNAWHLYRTTRLPEAF